MFQILVSICSLLIIFKISYIQSIYEYDERISPPGVPIAIYDIAKHLTVKNIPNTGGQGAAPAVKVKTVEDDTVAYPPIVAPAVYKTNEDVQQPEGTKEPAHQQAYPPGVSHTFYEHDGTEEEEEGTEEEEDPDGIHPYPGDDGHEAEEASAPENHNPVNSNSKASNGDNHGGSLLEHGHGHSLNKSDLQHLEQHMEIPLDTSKMTNLELAFHYFKVHDTDKNLKLDGLELIKFMIHHDDHSHDNEEENKEQRVYSDDELISAIDHIMNEDDLNQDGLISASEFLISYKKEIDNQNQKNESE